MEYTSKLVSALAIALVLLSSCEKKHPSDQPDIIGHRGLPTLQPENTKESFDALLKAGVFNVETDVLMCKGDTVFIFHDAEISRLTNMSGQILDYYPYEIRSGIVAKSGGTGITLNEFLDKYQNKFGNIYFDLKDGQGDIMYQVADELINQVINRNLFKKVIITSTSETMLEYIHDKRKKIKLASDYGTSGLESSISHHFTHCLIPIADMTPSLYSLAQSANVKLIAYTTSNIIECEKAIISGCDGVMTDVALEMKQLYSE